MTWHSLSPAAQDTFLLTLAWRRWWWWWRCGGLLCPIWSAGSPISAPPKPGGREAVAIAATTSTKATSYLWLCFLLVCPSLLSISLSLPVAEVSSHQTKAILHRFFPDFPCIQQTQSSNAPSEVRRIDMNDYYHAKELGLGISRERCGVRRSKCGAAVDGANRPYFATQARVRNPRL
jgi:hypothetical protein